MNREKDGIDGLFWYGWYTSFVTGIHFMSLVKMFRIGAYSSYMINMEYMPERSRLPFGDTKIRQVKDMTTGLAFSEEYGEPSAEVLAFSASGNPLPEPANYHCEQIIPQNT